MIFQKIFWEKDPEKLVVASFLIEKSNLKIYKILLWRVRKFDQRRASGVSRFLWSHFRFIQSLKITVKKKWKKNTTNYN